MKRFFLYGLAGLVILGGLAFGFRRTLFVYAITPGFAFADSQTPAPPNYDLLDHWAALPDRADSADSVPVDSGAVDAQPVAEVDVFFIHPTTYYSGKGWNAAITDADINRRTQRGALRHQASAFNGCCRIYAPRYRQATLAAFLDVDGNGVPALELAYADILAAFDQYITHYNQGRPFILAGHSQGARHGIRLLAERIEGTPIAAQLVAAYLVGYPIKLTPANRPFIHLQMCHTAVDTGCVINWNTFLDGGDTGNFRTPDALSLGLPEVQRTATGARVCINPLDWSSQGKVAASAHSGALAFSRDENTPLGPLRKNLISARCDDGYLYISDPGEGFQKLVFPGGNYHNYDYNLFYMNLRDNAIARSRAFLAKSLKP
jgi:hypothetical protein